MLRSLVGSEMCIRDRRVWMQHHQTKEWYQQATIVAMHSNEQTYTVQNDLGSTYTRGIRLLRPARQQPTRVVKARLVTAHLLASSPSSHNFHNQQITSKMPKALYKTKGVPTFTHQQDDNQTTVSPVADRALDLTLHQVSGDGGASHSSIVPCSTNFNINRTQFTDHSVSTIINSRDTVICKLGSVDVKVCLLYTSPSPRDS